MRNCTRSECTSGHKIQNMKESQLKKKIVGGGGGGGGDQSRDIFR